ncbi:hypothetical protein ACHAXS_008028 [Conticribra weissflogii]
MITSFFAPKSKSGSKRTRDGIGGDGKSRATDSSCSDKGIQGGSKRRVVSPPSPSPVSSVMPLSMESASDEGLSEETAEMLSYLDDCDSANGFPTWKNALRKQFASGKFTSLAKFVARERSSKTVYPPPHLTFSALNLTPLHRVKVVIVGQDPYHQPSQSHGISFSVPPNVQTPPSLRNIYKELLHDSSVPAFNSIPRHGNLERWAKQGVLLLNNVLTVRRGEPASHSKRGWEEFTDGVIAAVVERELVGGDEKSHGNPERMGTGVVFLLWGKPASTKAQSVLSKYSNSKKGKHAVICCSHPSPLGATKTKAPFLGSKCFSRANQELIKRGWDPIGWRVDGDL